jgi:two-component system sensor histidine kinase QseC
MTLSPPRSLQGRLLAGVLGAVGLLWMLAASWVWWGTSQQINALLDAHLSQSAALLVAQQSNAGEDAERRDEINETPLLHHPTRQVIYQVWHEHKLVLHSPNLPERPLSALQDGFETITFQGERWRLFSAHGAMEDVQVYVAEQLVTRHEITLSVLRAMLLPALLMLPLLAVAIWWAVRAGLAPLSGLSSTLAARSPQAVDALHLPGAMPTELAPLLKALNHLFDRIGALLDNERRFTADAAHELRTPIAAIRTQAQVALGVSDDAQRRHALQATLMGCDRATHLVEQLLALSRLETAAAGDSGHPVDLAALVQRVVAALAPAALARHQAISLQAPAPVLLPLNEALASMLVRNLVDNALRYSPEGATVRVTVVAVAHAATLCVDDSGPGLEEADLARLGERFFRVPGNEASGSGLGWSIVRRIAHTQQATVSASRSETLGGLAVVVTWPWPPAQPAASS